MAGAERRLSIWLAAIEDDVTSHCIKTWYWPRLLGVVVVEEEDEEEEEEEGLFKANAVN